MTRESRVLAALDDVRQQNQGQVIAAARMDNTTCALVLRRLVALGLVEMTTYRNGREGRPAYLYRRVTTRREQAA
ncbi:MAG: winged helix DNA-binding protein [Caldilineaceae bacterium]|nr:winged helix DNA-binding protein [Caldilineaceae bacterium]